jgi:ABC-type branched-subunit amino acid transport system substrate-binding protein
MSSDNNRIRSRRRDVLKGIGAAGGVALAGCAGDGGGGGSGIEARVGLLLPETGDLGSLGTTIRDGGLLAATQVDEADNGVTVDTQVEDTQTSPQAGISGAEALVNADYPAVVGSASSNVNLQITREVLIPNQTVGISPSSTAPAVTQLDDNDYIFRTAPSDALQGPVMARVAAGDRVGASTTATLFLNDAYGQALEEAYVEACNEQGIEVTNRVSLEPEQASYSTQWQSALEGNPDSVMVVAFPASGIQLFTDYYNDFAGDETVIVPDGLIDDDLPGEVDNDFANMVGTSPASAGPGADFFASAYRDEYGSDPQVFNAQAFDAMAVCILAQVAAGGDASGTDVRDNVRTVANPDGMEVTPEDLPDAVETVQDGDAINYQGASSSIDFDDNGDMRAVSYGVFEVEEREFARVETIDFEA